MSSFERTTFRPLQRYEQIAGRHPLGRPRPGERLPSERELAKTLEVSRASIREALASLALQGVVETRHGAGTFVVGLPPSEPPRDASPSAVLEARLALEPAVARLATARGLADETAEKLLVANEGLGPKPTDDLVARRAHERAQQAIERVSTERARRRGNSLER